APACRAGAVRGPDLDVVGEGEQLSVQRVVEHRRHRLRRVAARAGQIGAADVADEERVAGEDARRAAALDDEPGDRLRRVAGRLERAQLDVAEGEDVAVANGAVREGRAGARAEDDLRAAARGKLAVAAGEVGVQMRLDDVADRHALGTRLVEVELDVSTRGEDRGRAA